VLKTKKHQKKNFKTPESKQKNAQGGILPIARGLFKGF